MTAASLSVQLVLTIAAGILLRRLKIVEGDFDRQLTALIMKLCLPCLIIKSMMGVSSPEALRNSGRLILLAIGMLALTFALGQLAFLLMGKTASARIMRFAMIFTNFSFVGIPVIQTLSGELGVFYFVVFLVPYRMVYYSSAQPLLSPPGVERQRRSWSQRLKGWFSPPVAAVFIGLLLYLSRITLPAPVEGVISTLGSCASPLGMVMCGISLGRYEFRRLLRLRYLRVPVVRNLLLPGLILALSLLLGLSRELAEVVVVFAALPTASLLATFTVQYDPDPETQFEAAAAILLSTAFCAATIPLWTSLLERLFP